MDFARLVAVCLAVSVVASVGTARAAVDDDPFFDVRTGVLYLPVTGAPSHVTIHRVRSLVTLDMGGLRGGFSEVKGQVEGSRWIRTYWARLNPSNGGLHVVLDAKRALTVQVAELAEGRGLSIAFGAPEGAPSEPMQEVHQTLTVVPNDGSPIRTVRVDAKGPLPYWLAGAPPSLAEGPRFTWPSLLPVVPALSFSYGSLSEQYAPEAVAMTSENVPALGATWEPGSGGFRLPLRVSRRGYAFEDPDYPEVFHARVDTGLSAVAAWGYRLSSLDLASGLGYQGQWTQVTSTTAPPRPPAPSQFFFVGSQFLHGPFLYQAASLPLWGPLALEVELSWTPALWMTVGASPLSAASAWRAAPSLRVWPGVSIGYVWEWVGGGTFARQSGGASLGLHLEF